MRRNLIDGALHGRLDQGFLQTGFGSGFDLEDRLSRLDIRRIIAVRAVRDRILSGTYRELISKLTYEPVLVQGVFDLRKVVGGIEALDDGLLAE